METDKLEGLKYRELQKMAKDLGLKANGNKKDLIKIILEQGEKVEEGNVEEVEEELEEVEAPLIPMEESKLDATFEMDESVQNSLNETFEKEKDVLNETFEKKDALNETFEKKEDNANETFDKDEEMTKAPRFVEFSGKKDARRSSGRAVRGGGSKGGVATPKQDYLSRSNKTPLRQVTKTPRSIAKSAKKAAAPSHIPRFVEFARSRKAARVGKVPDFAKLHKKQQEKMESLTDTVTKQLDRAKALAIDHKDIVRRMNERKTPGKTPAAKHSGVPMSGTKAAKAPAAKFVPAALTTAKMNLNFGAGAGAGAAPFQFTATSSAAPVAKVAPRQRRDPRDPNQRKEAKAATVAKTPAARRRVSAARDTPDGKAAVLDNITNRSVAAGTPGKKFDIKASLAKPLNYKPHKGKLAPLGGKAREARGQDSTLEETKQRQMAVIKGVRLNKRAELMMKNRQLD